MSLPSKSTRPLSVGDEPGDHAHDGGFAAPFGTNQGNHLALGNGEAHAVYHGFTVILFGLILEFARLHLLSGQEEIEEVKAADPQ